MAVTPRRIAAVVGTGLLYGLSFPPFHLPFLAWVALVPLFVTLSDSTLNPSAAFRTGLAAGLLANLIIFEWLFPTFGWAQINLPTTIFCWSALAAILGLYFGAFAVFYRALPTPTARVWLGATAWVALDEVRSTILTGFPWALLSHTQARNVPLIQIASITGAAGVTFLLVAVNLALAEVARDRDPKRTAGLAQLAVVGGLVLAALGFGTARLSRADKLPTRPLTVALLQGNIDQYEKWDDRYEAKIRDTYGRLALRSASEHPDVMVWPESAVPAYIPKDERYVAWMVWIASATNVPQFFGSLSTLGHNELNSAFLMTPDGQFHGQYSKRHLVPFGEYVPFGGLLKGLVPYLGQVGEFYAGDRFEHFDVSGVKLSPNICYEAMFPSLVRASAKDADVIVNLTNDGWFRTTGAPPQHFCVNLYRAVENGRPVVRAANTGISAVIDAFGRIRLESPLMRTGAFLSVVPVPPHDFRTFFGRVGNWFGRLCVILAGSAVLRMFLRRKRRETPHMIS